MQQKQGDSAELRAAWAAREAQAARVAERPPVPPPFVAVRDPLPLCIYTTVALLAWIFSPPLVMAIFAALALRAYWGAWRAGLTRSKCYLRDTRLVMAYLAALLLLGLGGVGWAIWGLLA